MKKPPKPKLSRMQIAELCDAVDRVDREEQADTIAWARGVKARHERVRKAPRITALIIVGFLATACSTHSADDLDSPPQRWQSLATQLRPGLTYDETMQLLKGAEPLGGAAGPLLGSSRWLIIEQFRLDSEWEVHLTFEVPASPDRKDPPPMTEGILSEPPRFIAVARQSDI